MNTLIILVILHAVNSSPKFRGKEIQLIKLSCSVVVVESETLRQVMTETKFREGMAN